LIAVYIAFAGFTYTGEHVTQKLREKYLEAILGQNIAVFDHLGAGEVTTTITANMDQVMGGISEKVALTLTAATTFVAALIVGFVKNWRLSLVLLSIVFAVVFIMGGCSVFIVKYTKRSLDAYSPGAVLAEEVLTSVRTVTAFNGQTKLAKKFEESLLKTMHWGFRTKVSVGCMIASMMLISYLEYGLSFWEGSRLMVAGYGNLADTLTVLFALLMGAVSVAHAAPHIQSFAAAIAAAANIFKIIDRRMPEHTESQSGIPLEVQGSLEFQEVKHIYPSRPEVIVIQDFNLVIPAGKITALVGASGSGKSTIVGLIENFYPNVGGKIFLDGHDIQGLDTKWLRRQISLVSQEPVLFKCSIRRNIEHGLIGTNLDAVEPEKKSELVVQAAKMANAHDFISCLPNGYETVAGDRGVLLSGGQKQRIAIARAIISNPKILLLDEATSALDSQSEGIVQAALDVAAQGRTTIVIAHRLSTIKGADNIVVLSKGRVVEQGTHDQLLLQKGAYHDLIEAQNLNSGEDTYGSNPATDSKSRAREIQINHGLDNPILKDGYKPSLSTANSNTTQGAPIEHEDTLWEMAKVIASFNRQESGIMILGLLCSILAGLAMPVQGIIFAKCIVALSLPPTHYAQLRIDIDFWSLMFLIVAILVFIVSSSHGIAFAYCSEHLSVSPLPPFQISYRFIRLTSHSIYRARNKTFRSILRQDIAYFDDGVNSAGALTSLISKGTNDLAGISGAILGAILQLITTVIASIAISCVIGWKLGLVCSATIPVLLLCGFLRFWVLARFQTRSEKAYQASAALACEAVSAISTIASLTREEDVWNQYHCMLETQLQRSMGSVLKTSFLYAASQSFSLFCMALGFWYGGTLILAGEYDMFQFFVCFSSVIFSAQSAGALFSFAPDMAKSKDAAQQLKSIWDRTPDIDSSSEDGELTGELQGSVEFRDVHFSYPTRTEQPVLRGLNLKAESGQFSALVGESGCGKSTVVSLLERFYNPTSGGIFVDGRDISTLNVKEYRSRLALVSQEPVLYRGTIRENILLGIEDQSDTEEAIVEACKKANIYDFIVSFPSHSIFVSAPSTHLPISEHLPTYDIPDVPFRRPLDHNR
jgi:ATP-binding cassette subfamily B (MDR/TAP) protein 1